MPTDGMQGHPRLVLAAGGHAPVDSPQAGGEEVVFQLEQEHTTIGSAPSQQIVLEGLAPEHAVVDWIADGDEFIFRPLVAHSVATMDGKPVTTGLHHGDRVDVGSWKLVFQRDESADHVRKEGAREGGEHAGDRHHGPGGDKAEIG